MGKNFVLLDKIAAVAAAPAEIEIDYDYLAEKVAEKMPVPEVRTFRSASRGNGVPVSGTGSRPVKNLVKLFPA